MNDLKDLNTSFVEHDESILNKNQSELAQLSQEELIKRLDSLGFISGSKCYMCSSGADD